MMSLKGCVFTYCTVQINKWKQRFINVDVLFLLMPDAGGHQLSTARRPRALSRPVPSRPFFVFPEIALHLSLRQDLHKHQTASSLS
jgi:hypothetical protein